MFRDNHHKLPTIKKQLYTPYDVFFIVALLALLRPLYSLIQQYDRIPQNFKKR